MEKIMIYNGISPYLYLLAVCLLMDTYGENVYLVCLIVFLVQLVLTIIPEQICALNLIMNRKISAGKFILYLIGNCIYVVDVVLAVLIHREFKKGEEGIVT